MALVLVMLITVAVAALAAGAIFLTSSAYSSRRGTSARTTCATRRMPASSWAARRSTAIRRSSRTRVRHVPEQPAGPRRERIQIPGLTRSIYFGPTARRRASTAFSGASSRSSATGPAPWWCGAASCRRSRSARYAYYSDNEGSGICFGGGDQIFGPMHTTTTCASTAAASGSTARSRSPGPSPARVTGPSTRATRSTGPSSRCRRRLIWPNWRPTPLRAG